VRAWGWEWLGREKKLVPMPGGIRGKRGDWEEGGEWKAICNLWTCAGRVGGGSFWDLSPRWEACLPELVYYAFHLFKWEGCWTYVLLRRYTASLNISVTAHVYLVLWFPLQYATNLASATTPQPSFQILPELPTPQLQKMPSHFFSIRLS